MPINYDKIDEFTLALLHLVTFQEAHGSHRAWKGFDWDTMDRLHSKGYISDPKGKAKSVAVTKEGQELAEQLFSRFFGEDT